MELENKARELSEMLVESEIYKRYTQAKANLKKDTDLSARVDEYRRRNFYIQNGTAENKMDELRKLEGEYYETLSNSAVKEFLDAELLLCRSIQKINDIIMDGIDFEVDFIS